jgi:hypothetical protein
MRHVLQNSNGNQSLFAFPSALYARSDRKLAASGEEGRLAALYARSDIGLAVSGEE